MDDRELLEMAAKAAGIEWDAEAVTITGEFLGLFLGDDAGSPTLWSPLTDDGDALRLAVKLSLRVEAYTGVVIRPRYATANITDVYQLHCDKPGLSEAHGLDPMAATRRAITRAAAEIGKDMRP